MPKAREILVYSPHFNEPPTVCKTGAEVIAITGGALSTLKLHLKLGWSHNGFRVEYVHKPEKKEKIKACPGLDGWIKNHPYIRPYRRPVRWPLLSRRHVVRHLGIWR